MQYIHPHARNNARLLSPSRSAIVLGHYRLSFHRAHLILTHESNDDGAIVIFQRDCMRLQLARKLRQKQSYCIYTHCTRAWYIHIHRMHSLLSATSTFVQQLHNSNVAFMDERIAKNVVDIS